jgi:hypothetical protein
MLRMVAQRIKPRLSSDKLSIPVFIVMMEGGMKAQVGFCVFSGW